MSGAAAARCPYLLKVLMVLLATAAVDNLCKSRPRRGVASFPSVSADEKNRQNQHMRNKQIFERSKEVGEQPGVGRQSQTHVRNHG